MKFHSKLTCMGVDIPWLKLASSIVKCFWGYSNSMVERGSFLLTAQRICATNSNEYSDTTTDSNLAEHMATIKWRESRPR